ncbi:MAG: argininosuccinate lyase [Arenicellales bacterium WSBS_2016_MAG_OTU3]
MATHNMQNEKLWAGRFEAHTHSTVETFTASVHYDRVLYPFDIQASQAHARMLASVGVISAGERDEIVSGLDKIRAEIENGEFNWRADREDVHMNIEARLTELIGESGKKLHTGRSRNDQVATDMRLFVRHAIDQIMQSLNDLQTHLVTMAKREADTIMPGFTHMQPAQPVTLGHHLLAWNAMLSRDHDRFADCRKRLNTSPLGSAALAGSSFPLDREITASELGFDSVADNSLDAVSDRDFVIEFISCASIMQMHFSRVGEELVLWSTPQFDFVDLGDAFCTGSSIMPQKKNPDVAEIMRGKVSRVTGHLMAMLMLMKGQPLAYNRDNQEDKEPLFDTVDTVFACLAVLNAMLPEAKFKHSNMRDAAIKGYSTATDLADYLVRKNVPFRDAHEVVGRIVGLAISKTKPLSELPLNELQAFSKQIEADVFEVLTLDGSVNARNHVGGTAPVQVRAAAKRAQQIINSR